MRRNRVFIVLLVIVTVLAMATTALAGKPNKPGKPDKPEPPDIWTCEVRVSEPYNAVWLPGVWVDPATPEVEGYYVSDPRPEVLVDVPLCIDMANHKEVVDWTVSWVGEPGRKDPKGLMFIFEEEIPGSHYAQLEVLPTCVVDDDGVRTCDGSVPMTLQFVLDDDGVFGDEDDNVEHLVFLAMGRQGDKWENLEFTVTPHP